MSKGLTLAQVVKEAKRIKKDAKLTVSHLSMIENGSRNADLEKLEEIAFGLGVDLMKLKLIEFSKLIDDANLSPEKRAQAMLAKAVIVGLFQDAVP